MDVGAQWWSDPGDRRTQLMMSLTDAVRAFADGVRSLFRELYRTPPGC